METKELGPVLFGEYGPFECYRSDGNKDNFFLYLSYILKLSNLEERKVAFLHESNLEDKVAADLYIVKPDIKNIRSYKVSFSYRGIALVVV